MWEAAIGVVVGYAFALWWVRREAGKEVNVLDEIYRARLEAHETATGRLRDSFDRSQRALAAYERRNRFLESALAASLTGSAPGQPTALADHIGARTS